MTFIEFHNALRIFASIDGDEFIQAITGRDEPPSYWRGRDEWTDMERFLSNPPYWFIRAPTAKAQAVWKIVEARQPHVHVDGAP